MSLFNPDFIYPRDSTGSYVELEGIVTAVDDGQALLLVDGHGALHGHVRHPEFSPCVGQRAIVRVYETGGGFYPDNLIVRWFSPLQ